MSSIRDNNSANFPVVSFCSDIVLEQWGVVVALPFEILFL